MKCGFDSEYCSQPCEDCEKQDETFYCFYDAFICDRKSCKYCPRNLEEMRQKAMGEKI